MARRRQWLGVVVVGLLVLGAVVALGRWERNRWVLSQVAGMERVRAAVGPLDSKSLVGYRVLPGFDCLVYRRGRDPYALELCVDATGRVVEAIDRRGERTYYSLQAEPGASTFRIDRARVEHLLRKMGAFRT
jgi:hypothetical protein